jgi:hypothetical protein
MNQSDLPHRPAATLAGAALLLSLGACASSPSPVGATRFANRAPVWVVDDRRHVAEKPAPNRYYPSLYHYDGHVYGRLDRWMAMTPKRRAGNVNSLDEVPDSTWFTNRVGVRDLEPDDISVGPNKSGSLAAHRPLVIKSSKSSGINVGFLVEDQRGIRYLLKLEKPGLPETETGADVVAQRLLWAAGYNVPEDYLVDLERGDLVVADDAVVELYNGRAYKMKEDYLEEQLARVDRREDGRYRALLSRFVPGEPIGGHPREGVRPDDPNDLVAHELRRELRGLYPILAWLGLTDVKQDNFVDTYVADPELRGRRYVVHYLVDFDSALGAQGAAHNQIFIGQQHRVDLGDMAQSLASLSTHRRPFEGRERYVRRLRGVGIFESETFDPGKWKPYTPSYFPLLETDRFDGFWAAKIVARFTPAQIRAAVVEGRYRDPRAVDYLTRTLIERQRKTARYWFRRVNPLDRFSVQEEPGGVRVCFDDLAIVHRVASGRTHYRIAGYDRASLPTGWRANVAAASGGRTCVAGVAPVRSREGYTILRIETHRTGLALPATLVHLARHPRTGRLRLVGLRRL